MPTKLDKKKIIAIAVAGFIAVLAILFGVLAACGVFNKNVPDGDGKTENEPNGTVDDGKTEGITIAFDANGAAGTYQGLKVEPNENNAYVFTDEEKAAITEAFKRDGYDLCGLSKSPDGKGSWTVTFTEEAEGPLTLYAAWQAIFKHGNCAIKGLTEYGKTLSSVSIPGAIDGEEITEIWDKAFYNCEGLEAVTIPNGVTGIGNEAFAYCLNLKSVTIPDSVKSIGEQAFTTCSVLTSVIIPEGVTRIESQTFFCCESLTDVTLPNGVTVIGDTAFSCSGLTEITIPNSVKSIEQYAFNWCESLTEVILPKSVESIGQYAFNGCESLTAVYYTGNSSEWSGISIEDGNSDYLIDEAIYYYSETKPTVAGDFWHYKDNKPTVW